MAQYRGFGSGGEERSRRGREKKKLGHGSNEVAVLMEFLSQQLP